MAVGSFIHHPECDELIFALRPQASKVRVRPGYWITDPDGDVHYTDRGAEWCRTCGLVTMLQLQVNDPENADDYYLDGGWCSEHDTPPMCAGCGVKLYASLLTYGGLYELEHFRDNPPDAANPNECYEVSEMLAALSYTDEKNARFAHEAISIAKTMLARADRLSTQEGGDRG